MLYKIIYDEKKCPAIYVNAESLVEAHEKFYKHKFDFQLKEKDFVSINIIEVNKEIKDVHESNTPKLFGYHYRLTTAYDYSIQGICIADNYQQVTTKLSELPLEGIWRFENGDEIVIT